MDLAGKCNQGVKPHVDLLEIIPPLSFVTSEPDMIRNMKTKSSLYLLIISIALLVGIFAGDKFMRLFYNRAVPADLTATLLEKAKTLHPFTMQDHNQKTFGLNELKSKWSFMFFGYTHCPDVCPLAMQVMKQVWQQLDVSKHPDSNLQMLFVSVDPERDTPALLKQYAQYYDPSFIGITGKLDEVDNLTRQLGILYGYEEPDKQGNYHVNHSGQIILIDPQGNMRAVFSPPLDPKQIARDFQRIKTYVE